MYNRKLLSSLPHLTTASVVCGWCTSKYSLPTLIKVNYNDLRTMQCEQTLKKVLSKINNSSYHKVVRTVASVFILMTPFKLHKITLWQAEISIKENVKSIPSGGSKKLKKESLFTVVVTIRVCPRPKIQRKLILRYCQSQLKLWKDGVEKSTSNMNKFFYTLNPHPKY